MTPKHRQLKSKIGELQQHVNFCTTSKAFREVKRQPKQWEKIGKSKKAERIVVSRDWDKLRTGRVEE